MTITTTPSSVNTPDESDPRAILAAAERAWEEAKQLLEEAHIAYQPLRELRQSDEPFSGDWWRYTYVPALEHVLWAIENEKKAKVTLEGAELDYLYSNRGIEEHTEEYELHHDWRN